MYFNGSRIQDGSGVECVLINPNNKKHLVSSHLEFECMNNIDEYEALMLGLEKSINLNVVVLKVVGDLEIVVQQARNTIHCFSWHLKSYQQEVW